MLRNLCLFFCVWLSNLVRLLLIDDLTGDTLTLSDTFFARENDLSMVFNDKVQATEKEKFKKDESTSSCSSSPTKLMTLM